MNPLHHPSQRTLITGASSGIGAALARALAKRGSSLVLVARRSDRLNLLAEELRAAHPAVDVHTLALDVTREGAGAEMRRQLNDRGIAVTSVINNAGAGMWGLFGSADPDRLQHMIRLNVAAVVDISRAFLEQIVEAGSGYLVNLTSVAAYSSIPNQGAYSATKAFVLSFTESLWAETRTTGIRVLAFAPGVTDTEFFDVVGTRDADGGSTYQTPAEVAEAAIAVLERRDPPPSAVSGWRNHLLTLPSRFFTRRAAVTLMGRSTLRTGGGSTRD
jgi:short-subunit dehydrogenase